MDHLSTAKRSWNMSRIKSKNTKPELVVRSMLHRRGFRFSLHRKDLPGKPDIVLPKYNTVVFVHGCFWHGHKNCKHFSLPKTRRRWWTSKINSNRDRDRRNRILLKRSGWNVFSIFECELKTKRVEKIFHEIIHLH